MRLFSAILKNSLMCCVCLKVIKIYIRSNSYLSGVFCKYKTGRILRFSEVKRTNFSVNNFPTQEKKKKEADKIITVHYFETLPEHFFHNRKSPNSFQNDINTFYFHFCINNFHSKEGYGIRRKRLEYIFK